MQTHQTTQEQLRSAINALHSEHARLGVRSEKIDNATYSIETILGAQLDIAMPDSWVKYKLTRRDGQVFDLLYTRKGECVSREMFHSLLYASDPGGGPQLKVIDVFICHLRDKLEGTGLWIETMWGGLGWALRDGKGPPRTSHFRQVQWEGLWMGFRQAEVAQRLKESLGEVVPHAALRSLGFRYQPSACISTMRAKLKGRYHIEAVHAQGYRMTAVSTPEPAKSALEKLVA